MNTNKATKILVLLLVVSVATPTWDSFFKHITSENVVAWKVLASGFSFLIGLVFTTYCVLRVAKEK